MQGKGPLEISLESQDFSFESQDFQAAFCRRISFGQKPCRVAAIIGAVEFRNAIKIRKRRNVNVDGHLKSLQEALRIANSCYFSCKAENDFKRFICRHSSTQEQLIKR